MLKTNRNKLIKIIFILVAINNFFCLDIIFSQRIFSKQNIRDKKMFSSKNNFFELRKQMVEQQLKGRDIVDKKVLDAMMKVERHRFVLEKYLSDAYDDTPLPIGFGQTISQPYIVALMTQLLELKGDEKVLEIGTGSGYQAAILAELVGSVYSIEIIPELGQKAESLLKDLGYKNVFIKIGDGYLGWPQESPFDRIIVTCAPDHIPGPLIEQLKVGGKIVIPVGVYVQELVVVEKTKDKIVKRSIIPVSFVPMKRNVVE